MRAQPFILLPAFHWAKCCAPCFEHMLKRHAYAVRFALSTLSKPRRFIRVITPLLRCRLWFVTVFGMHEPSAKDLSLETKPPPKEGVGIK